MLRRPAQMDGRLKRWACSHGENYGRGVVGEAEVISTHDGSPTGVGGLPVLASPPRMMSRRVPVGLGATLHNEHQKNIRETP